MTQEHTWESVLESFLELTSAYTQDDAALLDERIDQKDVSRWRAGKYSRQPSAPKMAALRRVVRLLESGPGDYERGLLEAADAMERQVRALRARAGVITRDGGGSAELAALDALRHRHNNGGKGEKAG